MRDLSRDLTSLQGARPRISVIIVTYKSRELIDRCLEKIIDRTDFEILVWENASGDGISEYVKMKYPRVTLINSEQNLGFARANNEAFAYCHGQYYLLLNPDAFVSEARSIDHLATYLDENPTVGMVGPQLVNNDGSHQVGDAGWKIGFLSVVTHSLMLQRIFPSLPSIYLTSSRLLRRRVVSLDWVCGACTLVRPEVIDQVGGMDDKVFMYGEDLEWGSRIRGAGWNVSYLPSTRVLHLQGATQKATGSNFFSTKWLDDVAYRYALVGTRPRYNVMRAVIAAGFAIRAVVWGAVHITLPSKGEDGKSNMMWKYAQHAFNLPSFSEQRKKGLDK